MSEDTFYLRGVFGSGQVPVAVPADENEQITGMIVNNPVNVIKFATCTVTLLDRMAHPGESFSIPSNSINIPAILIKQHYQHNDCIKILEAIKSCDTRYAGKSYVIRNSAAKTEKMRPNDIDNICAVFAIAYALMNPVPVLAGTYNGVDLCETMVQIRDVVNRAGKTTIMLHGTNEYYKEAVQTFIFGDCRDRRTRQYGIVVPSKPTDKTIAKIKRSLEHFDGNIYVFSVTQRHILPRVKYAHVNVLTSILITPEQAMIYTADAPDDDAVTYDDNCDGDVDDNDDFDV